jgi:protein-S-isoprenylcysteine O-methyltransferase Ste14
MGSRGEGWVILQGVFFVLIMLSPRVPDVVFPLWLLVGGWLLMAIGAVTGILAVLQLGTNITPFPRPKEGGYLVDSGAYAFVRHPIYFGLIVAAFGWALVRSNLLGLVLAAGLFVFFDLKSRREEVWLRQYYEEYAGYSRRVKKLIPWLY